MKNNRSKEIQVGAVTILAVILLVLGFTFGKNLSITPKSQLIKIRFPNSAGIQIAEPVVVNGVKRGTVREVRNDQGSVLISVELANSKDIMSDATAKITLLEITGGKKIEITPGTSGTAFNLANEMPGKTPPDLSELVSIIGEVSSDAINLIRNLDTISSNISTITSDEKFISGVKKTISNAEELSTNLNEFFADNRASLQKSLNDINYLTSELKVAVQTNSPKINNIVDDLQRTITDARGFIGAADSVMTDARVLIDNLNMVMTEIKSGDGFVNKIIYDKELAMQLDSTVKNLGIFLNMVKENGVNVNLRLGTRP
ncbi:MAG: hypothetical protein CVV22_12160 [Ignavibacteriae bacterium HGW-Ignavibacteriae-1]|jgi:phospholipid/cholesterol/gamma-HCH transport system substrate-binding protein|nr:MAG: hypothetical protein CVV22_12160 [Ignavibacteriae bacterium HGW-Ignavibacteriae-1]